MASQQTTRAAALPLAAVTSAVVAVAGIPMRPMCRVGGDRMSSYMASKEALFRKVDDTNPDPELDAFEKQLTKEANTLGIGPMGFGGETTVLGVKVTYRHRVPACFFVSVTYMCWANRKAYLTFRDGQAEITQ